MFGQEKRESRIRSTVMEFQPKIESIGTAISGFPRGGGKKVQRQLGGEGIPNSSGQKSRVKGGARRGGGGERL